MSKKISTDTDLKIIFLLDHQSNYIERLSIMMSAKIFNILITNLNDLLNYFDDLTKLFSNLYLVKFSNISTKLFFPFRVKIRDSFYDKYNIEKKTILNIHM